MVQAMDAGAATSIGFGNGLMFTSLRLNIMHIVFLLMEAQDSLKQSMHGIVSAHRYRRALDAVQIIQALPSFHDRKNNSALHNHSLIIRAGVLTR